MVGTKEAGLIGSHPHSRDVLEKLRCLREEVVALEEELASGLESQDRCSVLMNVPHEKLETTSNLSGEVQQVAAIAVLPAASNEKREARKRKATKITTDDNQSEMEFEEKRVKREDLAFVQFRYQWVPGFCSP